MDLDSETLECINPPFISGLNGKTCEKTANIARMCYPVKKKKKKRVQVRITPQKKRRESRKKKIANHLFESKKKRSAKKVVKKWEKKREKSWHPRGKAFLCRVQDMGRRDAIAILFEIGACRRM